MKFIKTLQYKAAKCYRIENYQSTIIIGIENEIILTGTGFIFQDNKLFSIFKNII